jgi:hypothetical protein
VFVSFLCAILASAFYKYSTSREQMSLDDVTFTSLDQDNNDLDKPITITSTTDSSLTSVSPEVTTDESNNNIIESLTEIEIHIEETTNENTSETINENTNENENENENETNHEQISNDVLIDTIEGSEEDIEKQQIANIFRLLNDQNLINNWTTTDFLDQLKMYGLHTFDEEEPELA